MAEPANSTEFADISECLLNCHEDAGCRHTSKRNTHLWLQASSIGDAMVFFSLNFPVPLFHSREVLSESVGFCVSDWKSYEQTILSCFSLFVLQGGSKW